MPSSPSPPRNHGGESGVSQRSTSGNSTASNGPYDKQPQGTLPDVIEDHLTVNSSTHRNISEDNGFSNGTAQHIVSTNGVKSPPPIGSGVPPKSSSQRVGGPNGVKSPVPTGSGPVMGAQNGGYNQNGQSSTALPTRNMSQSQYPWSQHLISNASPFPRYGHASNYIAARDGEVFVMGGLKGSNVFGDLWVIETGKLCCFFVFFSFVFFIRLVLFIIFVFALLYLLY